VDPVKEETERLAQFAVFEALSGPPRWWARASETELCLRSCMVKMLERHAMVFGGMMVRLNIDTEVNFREGFREVAGELFQDGITWAKIVALFAFGARLGQHCRESGSLYGLVGEVADSLAEYASLRLTPWLREQGGWATLCRVFPRERDLETQLWQGLLALAACLSLASALMVARR